MAAPGVAARLRTRLKSAFAAVGVITVGGVAVQIAAARRRLTSGLPSEGFILELDLEQTDLVETDSPRPLAVLLEGQGRRTLQLRKAAEALREAGGDARVKGLVATVGQGGLGLAQTQELRDALAEFRHRAGRRAPTLAYADAFGEGGGAGTGPYYLASACEWVVLQPSGLLSVTGLAVQSVYARGFLDRWRIKPFFVAREEYKSAASFLINRASTKPEREAMKATLGSLSGQLVVGIAQARGLTPKKVQAAIDAAPLSAAEAAKLGLIDAVLYRDQAQKLAARLHEALSPAPLTPGDDHSPEGLLAAALAAAESARQAAAAPQPASKGRGKGEAALPPKQALLLQLLADPDAEPARKLKTVSLSRYAAAIEEKRRQEEMAARREELMGRLNQLGGRALSATGWSGVRDNSGAGQQGGGSGGQDGASVAGSEGGKDGVLDGSALGEGVSGTVLPASKRPCVALLTLTGPIVLGPAPPPVPGGLPGGNAASRVASLPVIKALRSAREDPAVKAVVLRVDSPGGSAAASDVIHREVSLLRAAGKPVVVSMGNAAASGGYYISAPADKIVAQPCTITGSIGVLAGKLVFDEALKEYGFASETIKTGRNADGMSALTGFDKHQRRKMEGQVDEVYARFKQVVSEGRGLSPAAVAKLAKGRVWTGEQALGLGLVDELGGLTTAIRLAKEAAGLSQQEGETPVREVYPERKSPFARALKALGAGGGGGAHDSEDGAAPAAAAAAEQALAGAVAAALVRPPTAAEMALLSQHAQPGGMLGAQCVSLEAERLAGAR